MKKKVQSIIVLSLLLLLAFTGAAFADVPTDNALQDIQNIFRDSAALWPPILIGYATRLFWILVLIDFVWMAIGLALNQGEFSDIAANVVRKILFIGFFWALLQPVGGQARGIIWANAIVKSLVQAGGGANVSAGGSPNISPAAIFDTGFSLCAQIFNEISVLSPGDSLALVIGGIIIMACFALIAAMMLLIYVQSYILIYAGVIFLGFGGSVFTKDIALTYLKASLSVGAKLFVMILVVGLGQTILSQWIIEFNITLPQIVLFIGASIVLLALVKAVPEMVGDMINGFSWGSGESLIRTSAKMGRMAVGAAAGAAVGAVGGTMAVTEASKLSSASGAGGFASNVAGSAMNLGKAAAQDTAGRLAGQHRGLGTKGGRMSAILKEHRLSSIRGSNQKSEPKDEPYPSPAKDLSKTGSIYKMEEES